MIRRLVSEANLGTVPNLVDLTTDEYSFVIKCPASRHLPVRRKTPPPCRGGGSKSRRGFPSTYHSARETKGSLRPRKENKTVIMAAARRTEGALRPRGCEPLRPFGARPPARRDSSFLSALTADIQKFVNAGTLRHPIASIRFPLVLNPPKCELFRIKPEFSCQGILANCRRRQKLTFGTDGSRSVAPP